METDNFIERLFSAKPMVATSSFDTKVFSSYDSQLIDCPGEYGNALIDPVPLQPYA